MTKDNKNKVLNVPTLRFPEFSGEWEKCKLGEICKFFSGGTPSTSNKEYYNGDIPFIRSGEIHFGFTELKISKEGLNNSSAKIIKKGDLLLALYGATSGDIAISKIEGAINQAILCIRTKYDKVFLKSAWEKHSNKILKAYLQGGQGNLSADIIKKIKFSFPLIDEQIKLSTFISLIDERIQTQKKIIDKYESLIKGLSNKLLYSKNGVLTYLYDILIERKERTEKNNQYKVLSSTINGILSQREYFSKDIASDNNIGYKVIHLYDIVLSPQNLWMGNINYNEKFNIGIVSPSYKIYIINEKYDKRFIANLLKTHRSLYKYKIISEQGASIVRRNLDIKAFEKLSFEIPAFEEQNKIGNIFDTVKQRLTLSYSMQSLYKQQKQWLLNHLFI